MHKLLGACAIAPTLFACTAASAAQVLIDNAEFSAGFALADGAYVAGHVAPLPGWTGSGSGSGTGHWNPTVSHFADEASHGGVAWTTGSIGLSPSGGFLGQVISDFVIRANTRYTLSVDAGRYVGHDGNPGYDFGLIAGWDSADEVIVARAQGGFATAGQFTPLTLTFATGASGLAIGQSLMIALGSSGGTAYDNVRLEATPLAAAVPEPSTWAMMIAGFGLAGGVVRRRRALTLAG